MTRHTARDEVGKYYEDKCKNAGEPLSPRQKAELTNALGLYNVIRTSKSPEIKFEEQPVKRMAGYGGSNSNEQKPLPVEERLRGYLSMPNVEREELHFAAYALGISPIHAFAVEMNCAGKSKEFVQICDEFLAKVKK